MSALDFVDAVVEAAAGAVVEAVVEVAVGPAVVAEVFAAVAVELKKNNKLFLS